ncbi:unnamed protein product, partial [Ectocarpus sp. 12 AP-2014]
KENIRKDRADYPACRNFSAGTCAWTGLLIKYPGKVSWLCASEFKVGEVVWAYTIPGASTPRPASSSRRTASPSTLGWPARTT